mgnify:CR=1 FL=1
MKWDLFSNRRSFLKGAALAGGLALLFGLERRAGLCLGLWRDKTVTLTQMGDSIEKEIRQAKAL